jgi:proteic killer suppression protein
VAPRQCAPRNPCSIPRRLRLAEDSRLVTRNVTCYNFHVAILKFRHKGLERFFLRGTTAGIQAKHASRLRLILGRLNVAVEARDMALPGLGLHPLKGDLKGSWAVRVSGNWRVTFKFSGSDVEDVDYEDYH